eukprot:GFYU01000806.1.p1 GENE.GFYU01000806.1~~GFYU01000806.1.p1  ORF type:complete len:565 (-),score=201.45 GFYU01000806.1:543-2237(-)
MSQFLQPSIILLKEGTDTSQGIAQLISNCNACGAIGDVVRSTLGPCGMDKLVYDQNGKVTISNDGATIMKLLDVVHPAAKSLVDIARAQDAEIGDGTTSVVVLACEFMKEVKQFVEEKVHPQTIMKAFRQAQFLAQKRIEELAQKVSDTDADGRRNLLMKCAATSLNSKLIAAQKVFFSEMVVDALSHLDNNLNLNDIGIKKEQGGSLQDSTLVDGVAFKKTFSYAGFEQQPKHFHNPKILLLNVELELKAEKENAEVRIKDPSEYQSIVDAEWNIIYEKLDKIVKSGAQVILSKLAIGDLATQYFADRGLFCAGRVAQDDLSRVVKATGATIQTSINDLNEKILGTCGEFEESQVGKERYNFFRGCPTAKTATIILRGGAEQFLEESHRSIHDALMTVKKMMQNMSVVAGGGAIEMELSKYLRDHARTIHGKSQLIINAYAKALEVIPRQIAENAGFDSTDILNKLRQAHAAGPTWMGVDAINGGICDTYEKFVWEPSSLKANLISAATEATCLILSVDETVKNAESEKPGETSAPVERDARMRGMGRGGGRGRAPIRMAGGR